MPRKPDRFERLVETELKGDTRDTMPIAEFRYLAELLLRRQHRVYISLVHKVWDWQAEQLADNEDACEVIIRELKRYAK